MRVAPGREGSTVPQDCGLLYEHLRLGPGYSRLLVLGELEGTVRSNQPAMLAAVMGVFEMVSG